MLSVALWPSISRLKAKPGIDRAGPAQPTCIHGSDLCRGDRRDGVGSGSAHRHRGLFRDRLGALAQRLDRQAVASWLVVQGRALDLHALGVPVP